MDRCWWCFQPPLAQLVMLAEMLTEKQRDTAVRGLPLPSRCGTAGESRAPLLASSAETRRTGFVSVGLVPTLDD